MMRTWMQPILFCCLLHRGGAFAEIFTSGLHRYRELCKILVFEALTRLIGAREVPVKKSTINYFRVYLINISNSPLVKGKVLIYWQYLSKRARFIGRSLIAGRSHSLLKVYASLNINMKINIKINAKYRYNFCKYIHNRNVKSECQKLYYDCFTE